MEKQEEQRTASTTETADPIRIKFRKLTELAISEKVKTLRDEPSLV
jgi:hypothetical protein